MGNLKVTLELFVSLVTIMGEWACPVYMHYYFHGQLSGCPLTLNFNPTTSKTLHLSRKTLSK